MSKYQRRNVSTDIQCGSLIIFEGPDGVGKTTISQEVSRRLNNVGENCKLLSFPGKTAGSLGDLVYKIHHDPLSYGVEDFTATSKQILHIAAHIDSIEKWILPTLTTGCNVILDRFWWSTWVYGVASDVDRHLLTKLIDVEKIYWKDIKPKLAILLRRKSPIDREVSIQNWKNLSYEYDALSEREKSSHPVIPLTNESSLEDITQKIFELILERLNHGSLTSCGSSPHKEEQLDFVFEKQRHMSTTVAPDVISHISPAKPTIVFDTYWRFATERQNIFFRKLTNQCPPWTEDKILLSYKFTNAYRASDRVSQYLIRNVIYRSDLPSDIDEVFFRIILFKLFNKIETWQLLEECLGKITYSEYSFDQYDQILSEAMQSGRSIYSAAYIMPSGGKRFGYSAKHRNHLKLIEHMIADELPCKLQDSPSMNHAFLLIRSYPGIGDFLAYQFVTDINYSDITNFSEMDFVVPGPGALDGIRKCFSDKGGLNEPEIIKFMTDRQDIEFERLGLKFKSLWGRPLQLIDCQNLFCEVDKYSRVYHPDISGISGRTRIKQRYSPIPDPIRYWYPPKWGINALIEKDLDC